MGIEWFRDLVICIYGIVGIIVCVTFAVIIYLLYQKIKRILSRIEDMQKGVQGIVNDVKSEIASVKEEVMSPLVQVLAVFHGIKQGYGMVSKMFKKEQGVHND
jgi:hypothetical protein